ncbi:MAG: diphthine--ammonia ligase [Thermodesulfobacteriota bacterium]|nr:diphthine--ammonia ligase [Thermodesulfobacteriota bacterium]
MILVSSWSGGKDSCLACYKAIQGGHQVRFLLNFISEEYKRCCFHGTETPLLNLQAKLIGIPLMQKEVGADMVKYETEFKAAVSEMKAKGIEGMVFGDVYLEEHRNWVERVCNDLEIVPVEPLWNISPLRVVEEFIELGFKAIVVSGKADLFSRDFIGRYLDKDMLLELQKREICPCGENGEFHTLVVDGPLFQRGIEILKSEPVLREGFWKHWFLDIKSYR